jgi:hypothetical protein
VVDPNRTEVIAVLEKNRIIDEINALNPSADRTWLESFKVEELADYLDHLKIVLEPASKARWVRRGNLAPIAMRECA